MSTIPKKSKFDIFDDIFIYLWLFSKLSNSFVNVNHTYKNNKGNTEYVKNQ